MSEMGKVLVVEDDSAIVTVVRDVLEEAGFACEFIDDGLKGLQRALAEEFDLIVLDVGLPLLNGLDVCRQLKSAKPNLPVIMLTARGEESDVVSGLEVGADDYVQKPFRPKELLARVRARLREETRRKVSAVSSGVGAAVAAGAKSPSTDVLNIGELNIDPEKLRVTKRGQVVGLSAREFEVVLLLATHPGRPFTREELLASVWEFAAEDYGVNVSVFMSRLRRKLEDDQENPRYLLTVRGVGYKFAEPSDLG